MLGQTRDINTYPGNANDFLRIHGIPEALIKACSQWAQWAQYGGRVTMTQATGTFSFPQDGTIYLSKAPMVDNRTQRSLDHVGGHIHISAHNPSNDNKTYVTSADQTQVVVNIKDKCTRDQAVLMFNTHDNMENLQLLNKYLTEDKVVHNKQCQSRGGGKKMKKKKSLKKKKL
jgi:hypothetical protein